MTAMLAWIVNSATSEAESHRSTAAMVATARRTAYGMRTANGGPGGITHMLNRCLFSDAEPPRRVDQGAQPIPDWQGPPCELNGSPWPEWYVLGEDGRYHYRRDLDPNAHG